MEKLMKQILFREKKKKRFQAEETKINRDVEDVYT